MSALECPRETEIVRALLAGPVAAGWEDDDDVHAHTAVCESCREAAAVAAALRDDRDLARGDLPVPSAGQVWWRAAVRARLEATQAAARPLSWAQGVAGACAAGVIASAITYAWPAISGPVIATVQRGLPFAVAAAAALVITPLALYLALSDE